MTKQEIIDKINSDFKGKCTDERDTCTYLNTEGKKCAIGLFIPDGHSGQHYQGTVSGLLREYPDLRQYMPFSDERTNCMFQDIHDIELYKYTDTLQEQKDKLIKFVEDNYGITDTE